MTTEKSRELYEKAKDLMPGGVSSPVRAVKPYPFYVEKAVGSRVWDVDGNDYIDYCMAFGPLILGHAHPEIKRVVRGQLEDGWAYGTPTELEVQLAEKIIGYYPGVDMLRLVNTGTEATMSAIRAARGYTGRDKFIKVEGGFHGAHDAALVKAGSGPTTLGAPDSLGVPRDFTRHTLQVPFNDPEAMQEAFDAYEGEIAAVIMEPVMGNIGPVLPKEGYLQEVRRITRENDSLLIFDEVIMGFRLGMSGAQGYYDVTPDLTTLGKIAGGGFPIGIFGGRRDIMEMVAPNGKVYQAGTFSGNPVSVHAGLAMIEQLEEESVHAQLQETGDRIRAALADIIEDQGLPYSVGGIASMFKVFFGDRPHDYQSALECDKEAYMRFWHRMLDEGVFLPPSQYETNFLSTAHSPEDVEDTIEAYERCLRD